MSDLVSGSGLPAAHHSYLDWLSLLALVDPCYFGILACPDGSMSFCVLHAARGTYDLNEPHGFASRKSDTLQKVGSEDWKGLDRKKALEMHLEALTGAVFLALLLAF